MAKKPVLKEEESVAAATLKPNPSRPEMLATLTQALAQLGMEDLTHYFNDAIAQIGHEADLIPGDAAARNAATIATKEDIAQIFGGDSNLTEEFTDKATTAFNALVEARTVQVRAELEEEYEQKLVEEAENVIDQITETLDKYLNYVAEQWLKDNELAVESSARTEIAEAIMSGIYQVFTENNLNIPENQVDVVEALTSKVEELEQKLDEEAQRVISMQSAIQESRKEAVFEEVTEGMTAVAKEKLRTISEGLVFVDEETFKNKLEVIKESGFDKTSKTPQALIEEVAEEVVVKEVPNDTMAKYAQAISKSIVKD